MDDERPMAKWVVASSIDVLQRVFMDITICPFCDQAATVDKMLVGTFYNGQIHECICVWCAKSVRDLLATVMDER